MLRQDCGEVRRVCTSAKPVEEEEVLSGEEGNADMLVECVKVCKCVVEVKDVMCVLREER